MKSRKVILFGVALILMLATCLIGCSPSADEITEAYQRGYDQGKIAGYDIGHAEGYAEGLKDCPTIPPTSVPAPTPSPTPIPTPFECPAGSIPWDEAINHVGERASVCGKVEGTFWSTGSNGKPTFLNIGKDHPASDRFVVVIWQNNRSNFPQPPEDYYLGKTITVTGLITEYNGVAEIEVTSPEQIEEC